MTKEQAEERLREVDRMIYEAEFWGSFLTILQEERRGLLRFISRETQTHTEDGDNG